MSTRKIPGSEAGWCLRLTTYHLLVPNVKKIWGLNLPDPHGPVQACSRTALLLVIIQIHSFHKIRNTVGRRIAYIAVTIARCVKNSYIKRLNKKDCITAPLTYSRSPVLATHTFTPLEFKNIYTTKQTFRYKPRLKFLQLASLLHGFEVTAPPFRNQMTKL
jgi:hypothetical protein